MTWLARGLNASRKIRDSLVDALEQPLVDADEQRRADAARAAAEADAPRREFAALFLGLVNPATAEEGDADDGGSAA